MKPSKLRLLFRQNEWNIVAVMFGVFFFTFGYNNGLILLDKSKAVLLLAALIYACLILIAVRGLKEIEHLTKTSELVKYLKKGGYIPNYINGFKLLGAFAITASVLYVITAFTYSEEVFALAKFFAIIADCILVKTIFNDLGVKVELERQKEGFNDEA